MNEKNLTITFDSNNANATSMLQVLLASGLFKIADEKEWTQHEEREAFLHTSRINSSNILSRYV